MTHTLEDITIYDDFLNEEELKQMKTVLSSVHWNFGKSTFEEDNLFDTPFWGKGLERMEFFNNYLTGKITKIIKKHMLLTNVYASGMNYGQDAIWHIDNDDPNSFTLCLYIYNFSSGVDENIGGLLDFKVNDSKFIYSLETKNNRAVLFPGTIYHRGNSYNRFVSDIRICLTWKFVLDSK